MEMLLVTGLSGSGKSQAVNVIEDMGYYCIDNIPAALISTFIDICSKSGENKVAVVTDARSGDFFSQLAEEIKAMRERGVQVKILFLDCDDATLVRRYKETRRRHPLLDIADGDLQKAVIADRVMVRPIKEQADYIIDTTLLSVNQLKRRIVNTFSDGDTGLFQISVSSFGFKYGIPSDADLVYDVRFLPNPFYDETLRPKTGLESDVRDYVFKEPVTQQFVDKLKDLLLFCVPHYKEEGKSQLNIAIGCTGGKHRSVAIAEELNKAFIDNHYKSRTVHRDIAKDR